MTIMTRLKNETKEYHKKLESLPYFEALITHRLPLECYVNQLRALSIVHGVMEEQIATSTDEKIIVVWQESLRKLPLLEEDLAFFAPRSPYDYTPSINAALVMAEKIRLRNIEQPVCLLGYLYVMEGSTLGNHMHQPDITKNYQLNGFDGSRYYSSYQDKVVTRWQQFSQRMNSILDDQANHQPVIEAAHEAFDGLELLYKALFPMTKNEQLFHVSRINPEAGNHPIPEDQREVQAALAASTRCWNEFSYFEKRYGKRGKRFSDSDACWLVTLTKLDQQNVQKQVEWLCRVLTARGMPSIMIESILRHLYEELTAVAPENKALYRKLTNAADILKNNRLTHLDEKAFTIVAEEFEQTIKSVMREEYRNTGRLLVAVVVDEKNGMPGARSALERWLTDVARFSPAWISAVRQTLQKADDLIT